MGLSIKGRGKQFKIPLIFTRKLFCYTKNWRKPSEKKPPNWFFLICMFVCWLVVVFLVFQQKRRWQSISLIIKLFLFDSKLQGLVNVNITIRKCHPKMFCTYARTKKISFSRRATGYHFKQQKIQE